MVVGAVSKGKTVTGMSPVWPGALSLENCSPRPNHSWGSCSYGPLRACTWSTGSARARFPSESLVSCSPDFLSGERTWLKDHNFRMFSSLFCSLRQVFSSRLPPNPPGPKHSAPLFPCLQSLWTCDFLCADCRAAQFPDPLVPSLSFPAESGESAQEHVALRRCSFSCFCDAALHGLAAFCPGSHLPTAGPQLAPRSHHYLCCVVKGLLLGFHDSHQGPAVFNNVC